MRIFSTSTLLSLITLVQCTISGVFGPILLQILINAHLDPDVLSHLGKSFGNSMLSVVLVYLLCPAYLFLAPIVCAYTDGDGRKPFFCASILAAMLGYALIWFSLGWASEPLFLFGLFFFSASKIYLPIAMSIVTDLNKNKKRELAFGFIYLILLTIIISSQYGYYLLKECDDNIYYFIEKILIILMVIETLNLALAVFIFPETHKKKSSLKHPLISRIMIQLTSIFENKKMPRLFFLLLLTSFLWSLYFQTIYNILIKNFDLTPHQSNKFILYQLCLMGLGVFIFYRFLLDKITYSRIMLILNTMALGFIGCGLFAFSLIGQIIFVIPLALGAIIAGPILSALISREWDRSQYGLLMGIIAPALTVTWILSGVIPIEYDGEYGAFSMLGITFGGTLILLLVKLWGRKLFLGEKL